MSGFVCPHDQLRCGEVKVSTRDMRVMWTFLVHASVQNRFWWAGKGGLGV